jgi:hypothetical protein
MMLTFQNIKTPNLGSNSSAQSHQEKLLMNHHPQTARTLDLKSYFACKLQIAFPERILQCQSPKYQTRNPTVN